MPAKNGNGNENFAAALAEVSDRLTRLVQEEIELAKAEVSQKATSLARGAAAVAAGAVFGVFAVVFLLLTLAWVIDGIFVSGAGSLWLGFLVVLVVLVVLMVSAFLFAWKKLSVGAPTPKMAISEGKKIKDTVTALGNDQSGGDNGHAAVNWGGAATGSVRIQDNPAPSFASGAGPAVAVGALVEPTGKPEPVEPAAPAPSVDAGEPRVEPVGEPDGSGTSTDGQR